MQQEHFNLKFPISNLQFSIQRLKPPLVVTFQISTAESALSGYTQDKAAGFRIAKA
jgi:hypothetical protein